MRCYTCHTEMYTYLKQIQTIRTIKIIQISKCTKCKISVSKLIDTIKIRFFTKKRLIKYLLSLSWIKKVKYRKRHCIDCGKREKGYRFYINITKETNRLKCSELINYFPFRFKKLKHNIFHWTRDDEYEDC